MRRALITLVAALALAVVPLGSAETSYSDPAGDSGPVPDLTTVTVSNTDAGVVTMRIGVPLVGNTFVGAMLDTDRNPSTGSYGVDRTVMIAMAPSGMLITLVMDGNGAIVPGIAIPASYSAGTAQFSFPKETFGVDQGLNFWLWSSSLDETVTARDDAPNDGWWSYELTKPAPPPPPVDAVKPVIGKPVVLAAPVAGKRFTVAFPVVRSDDGTPLTTGAVRCTTTVAGKTIPHTHTFKSGTVKATLVVPKAAKGKQLKIAVKVTAGSQAATKAVTFKVK